MAFNRKIKNKNIGYFLINKRVFSALSQAEQYCDKHCFDVNEFIRSENPEVLEEAHQICSNVLPLLYDIRESIKCVHDKQIKLANKKLDEFNESKTKRDLLRDYKNEKAHEALGIIEGISMVRSIIERQIEIHEKVICLRK